MNSVYDMFLDDWQTDDGPHTTTAPADPLTFVREHLHFYPGPDQLPIFDPAIHRGLVCCTRQFGKSTTLAALAVHRLFTKPGALVVVVAPTAAQSGEFLLKCRAFARELGISSRG